LFSNDLSKIEFGIEFVVDVVGFLVESHLVVVRLVGRLDVDVDADPHARVGAAHFALVFARVLLLVQRQQTHISRGLDDCGTILILSSLIVFLSDFIFSFV